MSFEINEGNEIDDQEVNTDWTGDFYGEEIHFD